MTTPSHFHWFDAFVHRTRITATFDLETGLRVGTGRALDALTTDLPLHRDARGRPLLPGSSLKGVVRSAAERLLRGHAISRYDLDEDGLRRVVCDPLDQRTCCQADDGRGAHNGTAENDPAPATAIRANRDHARTFCLACATFGAMGLASHARFRDAVLDEGTPTRVRDGVAIDRDLGRVSGARKYDFEVVDPGARFDLVIDLENDMDWQAGLVIVALDLVSDGIVRIGGFGSRGLGQLALREIRIHRKDLDDVVLGRDGRILPVSEVDRFREALLEQVRATCEQPSQGGRA